MTLPGTGGAVSFQYDPFGRRIQKTNASGTTAYVYDGDNIVEELTGATERSRNVTRMVQGSTSRWSASASR